MKPIAIIDCAVKDPSFSCVNRLVEVNGVPFTYHWVSNYGFESLENLKDVGGFIIFGSHSNVSDRFEWQTRLAKMMMTKIENNIPVMGICFGHQLIADAYGARVDLVTPENLCFEGVRKQKILVDSHGFSANEELEIFITHHYEVKNLPNEFIHLGTSSQCFYDSLAHKTKPYISFQGHPEASLHFLKNYMKNPIDDKSIERALESGSSVISRFIKLINT